jgi:hypothetical protein
LRVNSPKRSTPDAIAASMKVVLKSVADIFVVLFRARLKAKQEHGGCEKIDLCMRQGWIGQLRLRMPI